MFIFKTIKQPDKGRINREENAGLFDDRRIGDRENN